MATTWGQFTWGSNSWNTEVNIIIPTGIALTANLGTPASFSTTGWGRYAWGDLSWGVHYSNITEIPTGFSLPMVLSEETITTEINTGWGRSSWGAMAWGIAGDVQAGSFALPTALNSVTVTHEVNIGWGSDGWGVEGWGSSIQVVQPSGIALTMAEGGAGISTYGDSSLTLSSAGTATAVTGAAIAYSLVVTSPTGIAMTMNLSFDPEYVSPTGIAMTTSLGSVDVENITIAEVSATSAVTWGNSNWGYGVYGNQQVNTLVMAMQENFSGVDPSPDAMLVGQSMAANLTPGSSYDITGDANVTIETAMGFGNGYWGESRWGNGVYFADPNFTFSLAMGLGSVVGTPNTVPDITGFALVMQEGDEDTSGNAKVDLTGNTLTFALGTATNVLIWNEVPTGTAPVDPPGWQEVDTSAA
tara:strand:+ start:3262 stop:4506 length:1245 start_codon:yes stop_codon:yes gene_type:complete